MMKIFVFWDVAPCGLLEVYGSFRGVCCLHLQGDRPDDEPEISSELTLF
jgi:hypothetical protein